MNYLFQLLEPGVKKLMIVLSPSISRNAAIPRLFVGAMVGEVVDPQGDDRSAAGKHLTRVGAFIRSPLHPGHGAVIASPEPFGETLKEALRYRGFGIEGGAVFLVAG
jgi:hypothetical protein